MKNKKSIFCKLFDFEDDTEFLLYYILALLCVLFLCW